MATTLDFSVSDISLPDLLLFDASILLELVPVFGTAKPERNESVLQFLERVREARRRGECFPLVAIHSLLECYHKILLVEYERDPALDKRRDAIAHRRQIDKSKVTWHHLYKDSPKLVQRYYRKIENFFQAVRIIPVSVIEPEDLAVSRSNVATIEERVRYYIKSHCLWVNDGYLVAVAERLGVYQIATLDRDFDRLGDRFTLYTMF